MVVARAVCYAHPRPMAGGVGIASDARMLAHDAGPGHPERPERLRVLLNHLEHASEVQHLAPRRATVDEITLVHDPRVIDFLAATAGRPRTVIDADTATSAGSWEAAQVAAGCLLTACEAVLAGQVHSGCALVRPPGHHAEYGRPMGFCLLNNVAIAAAWLRRRGLGRVAIVDWDLHHGNGTQHLFEDDPDVLYVSTHQYPYYPGTGAVTEVGRGAGVGRTVNLPFPAGFGDAEFRRGFDEIVAPVLHQFAPDFVLISAGFDCDGRDPLGGLRVTPAGIAHMTQTLCAVAAETAQGRVVAVLEGGYDLDALVEGVDAVLRVMQGHPAPLVVGSGIRADGVLATVRAAQAPYWDL